MQLKPQYTLLALMFISDSRQHVSNHWRRLKQVASVNLREAFGASTTVFSKSSTTVKRGRVKALVLLASIVVLSTAANAQEDIKIEPFRESDRLYLQQGIERINDLTERHFGASLLNARDHDLALLQRLLNANIVTIDQRKNLQAMGIVLGEQLRRELGLKWIRYFDAEGSSRGLQLKRTQTFWFPITMVSRRAEVGASVNVMQLFLDAKKEFESATQEPQGY